MTKLGPPARIETRRAVRLLAAAGIGAVLLTGPLPTARAGGDGGDNILLYRVYEDNPAFCRRLIEQARQVEFIEPVLPDTVIWRLRRKRPASAVYFADKAPPDRREAFEALEAGEWDKFFEPGNVPPGIGEHTRRIVLAIDPRWQAYEAKCPGFVGIGWEEGGYSRWPNGFALYRVDIDNDGAEEYILYQNYDPFNELRIIDFETCTARKIEEDHSYRPEIVRFEGQNYILHYGNDWIGLYRSPADSSGADHTSGDAVCVYSPIRKLTDYLDHGMTLKRDPIYKRSDKP